MPGVVDAAMAAPEVGLDRAKPGAPDGSPIQPDVVSSMPVIAVGGECRADTDCSSGHCADGVCCNESCDTPCRSCDLSTSRGVCQDNINSADGDSCPGTTQTCVIGGQCGQVDQQQNGPRNANGGLEPGIVWAQTVTVGRAGKLVGVRIGLRCGDIVVSVQIRSVDNGIPTDTVLATAYGDGKKNLAQRPDGQLPLIIFPQPITVQVGQKLAFVLSVVSGPNSCYVDFSGSYPGGTAVLIDSRVSPQWTVNSSQDLLFQTFVVP